MPLEQSGFCQEEEELGLPSERQESLEEDHIKCQEGLLVLQVLNYKSCVRQDFGKGPQKPEYRDSHSTFPSCNNKDPIAECYYTLETHFLGHFSPSSNLHKGQALLQ